MDRVQFVEEIFFLKKKMVYDETRRNSRPKLRPVLDAALNNLFFQKLFLP